jgi:hypothetical protein
MLQLFNPFLVILNEKQLHKAFYTATDQRYEFVLVSGTKGVYLEGRVQLKHFYKKQSIKHILCSQSYNGAVFVPDSENSFCRFKKWRLPFTPTRVSNVPTVFLV